MLDKKWTDWSQKELEDLKMVFEELNMFTDLVPTSEDLELPVLSVGLQEFEDDVLMANLTFSPFEKENIDLTKFLHMGVEFGSEIKEEEMVDIALLIAKLNNYLPIGHFNILENHLSYRYVCAISSDMKSCNGTTVETFSLFSLFAMQFNELFTAYSNGEKTLLDLEKALLS